MHVGSTRVLAVPETPPFGYRSTTSSMCSANEESRGRMSTTAVPHSAFRSAWRISSGVNLLFRIPGPPSPASLASPQSPVTTGPRLDQLSGTQALAVHTTKVCGDEMGPSHWSCGP